MRRVALAAWCCLAAACGQETPSAPRTGSVIFYHVDGAGLASWQMTRALLAGPDGEINWDRLPHLAVYRGHTKDSLTPSSNAGATMHAFGVKAPYAAFGLGEKSGRRSLMREAQERGISVGVVNSGSLVEPGTACFLTHVPGRENHEAIIGQLVASGARVIFGGGEEWFLPAGVQGYHGEGRRTDGRNLIEEAKAAGYQVIFTREELRALPATTAKVLGLFAAQDTFHDLPEEKLGDQPTYDPAAPTIGEMTEAALKILGAQPFLLVVEEEGADNFGNLNNAVGMLDGLRRADQGLGVAMDFVRRHPDTLLLTCADSVAGAPDMVGLRGGQREEEMLRTGRDANGAPVDGAKRAADGRVAEPFLAAPDRAGRTHEFVVVWGTTQDAAGGIVVRADGLNAAQVRGSFDNTDVYKLMRSTLFGTEQ